MGLVHQALVQLGASAERTAAYAVSHPRVLLALVMAVLGTVIGIVIVSLGLLTRPMNILWVLVYALTIPTAVFAASSDHVMAKRLWVAALAGVMGILAFRVIFDLIGLEAGLVRSNVTGLFGLICWMTGFLKVQS